MRCSICDNPISQGKARCSSCGAWNMGTASRSIGRRIPLRSAARDSVERLGERAIGSTATNGGYPRRTVTLLGGEPGTGKSTMALQVASCFRRCLYLASEESASEIRARAERIGDEHLLDAVEVIECSGTWPESDLEGSDHDLVVLDSLPGLVGIGNDVAAQEVLKSLKKHVVSLSTCAIVVDHATKSDYFAGRLTLQHEVDCTLVLVCDGASERRLISVKNRHGPSGREEHLELTEQGYAQRPQKLRGP